MSQRVFEDLSSLLITATHLNLASSEFCVFVLEHSKHHPGFCRCPRTLGHCRPRKNKICYTHSPDPPPNAPAAAAERLAPTRQGSAR